MCNASGVCEACTTATVTHSDINESGCCVTSTETYCPATDETPTARTCTQTCSGTCETDGTCTPAAPTCTGDLVLNSDETACICPTGKKLKTGTTDTCVECNANTDCTDTAKPVCDTSGVCEENPEGKPCDDNRQCKDGYFCNYGCGTVRRVGGLCSPSGGKCAKVSDYYIGTSGGYIWGDVMAKDSAANFCRAQNKYLVEIDSFNCYYRGFLRLHDDMSEYDMQTVYSNNGPWYCCAACYSPQNTNNCCNSTTISPKLTSLALIVDSTKIYWTASRVPGDNCPAFVLAPRNKEYIIYPSGTCDRVHPLCY